MTQMDSPFDASPPAVQKTSGLAVGSLVCSLVFCCPLTTIVGILLGIGALVSIGGDPGKRGKGLAVTGIVLGAIFTIGQAVIYPPIYKFARQFYEVVQTGPHDALQAGSGGDIAGFKQAFHGAGNTAPDAEAQAFIDELEQRYGAFVGSRFDDTAPPPQSQMGKPEVVFPYRLEFENATVQAEAQIIFADERTGRIVNKLGFIRVIDEERGNLVYPPSAAGNGGEAEPGADAPEDAEPAGGADGG